MNRRNIMNHRNIMRCAATMALLATSPLVASTDIYSTGFDKSPLGNLSGQVAWSGVGGTWATSGSMNASQVACLVLSSDAGIVPPSGAGKMVRVTTERFNAGRTKGWLDLANSGKWAAASATGGAVLETHMKLYLPSGQLLTSAFGAMISRTAVDTSGGFVVSAQTGAVSLLSNGYTLANRTATGRTVSLNAWHEFVYRWNTLTGEGELLVDGESVATHTTSVNASGGVYAANLFATTDTSPGTLNAYGYVDDFAIAATSDAAPCAGDFDGNGTRDGADLAALLAAWGTAGGDLNGDNLTDGADLAVFLGAWGPCG
jgi:hypothetical protein